MVKYSGFPKKETHILPESHVNISGKHPINQEIQSSEGCDELSLCADQESDQQEQEVR